MSNHSNHATLWTRYTFLQDTSSDFVGYTHHGRSMMRNETRNRRKTKGSTTSCCVICMLWDMRCKTMKKLKVSCT